MFHANTILSGEYNCLGMDDCFLVRYRESINTGGRPFEEISSEIFRPFANGLGRHNIDYNHQIWQSLAVVHMEINRLICRATLGQGISFCPAKNYYLKSMPYISKILRFVLT